MNITREFYPADRYLYDFGLCSATNGWAQIDTDQDAPYFGTWAHPAKLLIFSYTEGDTCLIEADNGEEFAAELRRIDAWNREQGYRPAKIDGLCQPAIIEAFEALGLADMLH